MAEISIVVNLGHHHPEPSRIDDDPVILRKSDLERLADQISGSDRIIISVGSDQAGNIYITSHDHRGSPGHHSFQGFANTTEMAEAIKSYAKKRPTK